MLETNAEKQQNAGLKGQLKALTEQLAKAQQDKAQAEAAKNKALQDTAQAEAAKTQAINDAQRIEVLQKMKKLRLQAEIDALQAKLAVAEQTARQATDDAKQAERDADARVGRAERDADARVGRAERDADVKVAQAQTTIAQLERELEVAKAQVAALDASNAVNQAYNR